MAIVVAMGIVSPLGRGRAGYFVGEAGSAATTAIARDAELEAIGLRKPFCARVVPTGTRDEACDGARDPATALLFEAFEAIANSLRAGERVGVSIGSSSGAMRTSERLFAAHRAECAERAERAEGAGGAAEPAQRLEALAKGGSYAAPFEAFVAMLSARGVNVTRRAHVLTACSSSTIAIGLAKRWLDADACDVVIAGGYDALTTFVAAGFEALGATTATTPRPFRLGRDGMSLGEGAGMFLLGGDDRGVEGAIEIAGFGVSGDAVHLTAPDRSGGGMARAAVAAMAEAGTERSDIDLVSLHGTATAFNDPMEARALETALGDRARDVPVCASKAVIGHTLGAAGVLETALVVDALRGGVVPATPGSGAIDPDAALDIATTVRAARIDTALKLSAAFGGANAALIVRKFKARARRRPTPPGRSVGVSTCASVAAEVDLASLAASLGTTRDRLARMDASTQLALAAVDALAGAVGRETLRGAGIVLGSFTATIEANALYDAGIAKRGAAFAEGRRFAYTTPNAAAGECAIAFGLTGPNVAVSRGRDAGVEAEEVARDLLAAGDADRLVVVEVETAGELSRMLLEAAGASAAPGACARLFSCVG